MLTVQAGVVFSVLFSFLPNGNQEVRFVLIHFAILYLLPAMCAQAIKLNCSAQ